MSVVWVEKPVSVRSSNRAWSKSSDASCESRSTKGGASLDWNPQIVDTGSWAPLVLSLAEPSPVEEDKLLGGAVADSE